MHYHEAINRRPNGWCPFCHLKTEEVVKDYKHFVIIVSRAPYCEDHLLVIPKEHDILLHDMSHERHIQMFKIVDERNERLHSQHQDVTFLLRDGKVGGHTGKSQNHLHFHLIPDMDWANAASRIDGDRKFFDDEEYIHITQKVKDKYL